MGVLLKDGVVVVTESPSGMGRAPRLAARMHSPGADAGSDPIRPAA
jgi:hypothetical protein